MNTPLVRRIAMTSATLLTAGAIGFTGLANAASSPDGASARDTCSTVCLAIYDPVTCVMSDGSIRKFGNRCEANVYACQHRLTIIACWPPNVD